MGGFHHFRDRLPTGYKAVIKMKATSFLRVVFPYIRDVSFSSLYTEYPGFCSRPVATKNNSENQLFDALLHDYHNYEIPPLKTVGSVSTWINYSALSLLC
jgi:hypothetical protein